MKKYTEHAPFGVTAIQLDNGDEAIYLHGECIACADMGQHDDSVIDMGERLAITLGVPFHLLSLPVPDDNEWTWNDVVTALGWGKSVTLDRMVVRPVLECCISHITKDDNALLKNRSMTRPEGEWIIDTGVGYLIRLEAEMHPLMHLKRFGLSRTSRWLIIQSMKQADISMIHFSLVGEVLANFKTFDW